MVEIKDMPTDFLKYCKSEGVADSLNVERNLPGYLDRLRERYKDNSAASAVLGKISDGVKKIDKERGKDQVYLTMGAGMVGTALGILITQSSIEEPLWREIAREAPLWREIASCFGAGLGFGAGGMLGYLAASFEKTGEQALGRFIEFYGGAAKFEEGLDKFTETSPSQE